MSNGKSRTSANQMQRQVECSQAPKSVIRVDKGRPEVYDRYDHIHFKSGEALYSNGEWKHGQKELSREEKKWITDNGWSLPSGTS